MVVVVVVDLICFYFILTLYFEQIKTAFILSYQSKFVLSAGVVVVVMVVVVVVEVVVVVMVVVVVVVVVLVVVVVVVVILSYQSKFVEVVVVEVVPTIF